MAWASRQPGGTNQARHTATIRQALIIARDGGRANPDPAHSLRLLAKAADTLARMASAEDRPAPMPQDDDVPSSHLRAPSADRPGPVNGCVTCAHLARFRERAYAAGDGAAVSDADARMRRHHISEHDE
ncbi:hypothetical protein GCM10009716_13430 [Streptomyces sodiiphilus]|uniref:Uncharacterized protein n=1 Tax=Streptomyces sodiiphilus TaxID=226217 RepID=A0ABN2NWS4_9ACTN